ncbi:protein translocase subunit SecD, partial [Candidatus Parcubacteria bacterium]
IYVSAIIILLVFIWTASVAYPKYWNAAAKTIDDNLGIRLYLSEQPYKLGLDLQGGVHLVYEADMSEIPEKDRASALEGVRDVIERRVNAYGVSEPVVLTNINNGHYRVIVELAGVFDVSEAIKLIGETPILEFKVPNDINSDDLELTEEQKQEMEEKQKEERAAALEVLDKALAGEDFGVLAQEYSIDEKTKNNGGYIGFVDENNQVFGELVQEIEKNNYTPGVIDGLYEYDSTLHIVKYISEKDSDIVTLSHILICYQGAEKCESDRSKEQAIELINQVREQATPDNFAELAKEYSDGPSAKNGGSLGEVTDGMMVSEFEEAYKQLSDGEISDPVETKFGYHIIYREKSRPIKTYEIAHIEMPWTTESDILKVDLWKNTGLSGKQVTGASVAFDQKTNTPYVVLNFNDEGSKLFADLTESHVGDVIGIFLDGSPISTPVVQEPIYGGQASITGSFTIKEAKLLAQRLNAGALPVPIELLSQQTVGPTLGHISLEKSIKAAIAGLILLAIFMTLYYRLAGLLAILALAVYTSINLTLYKWLGVTMTLSGIAGFILSLGMAVDANVLIFERMKEELKSGRDLATAIDEGFRRAWSSIRDGNITTLIAAFVLFTMSTSFVKGFALTLALGILVSMATAILVTRILLKWLATYKIFRKNWLYGVKKN